MKYENLKFILCENDYFLCIALKRYTPWVGINFLRVSCFMVGSSLANPSSRSYYSRDQRTCLQSGALSTVTRLLYTKGCFA